MRAVSEIRDRDSLRAWLEALPQETKAERDEARRWAVAIAHRASFRASTAHIDSHLTFADLLDPSDLTALFRSLLLPMIFVRVSNEYLRDAATHIPPPGIPVASRFAGREAARANCLMLSSDTFVDNALETVEYVADTMNECAVWRTLAHDCQAISSTSDLSDHPIWPRDVDLTDIWPEEAPFIATWSRSREVLQSANEGWRFWVDWYDNTLHGRPQDYALLTKIALIDPADWDKGADHVNALIAGIRAKHIAETRPLGEDAIAPDADGVWHRVGRSAIDRDILQDAIDSVRDEIARLRSKLQGPQGNMFTALIADIDLLDARLARYPDRPLRLHDTFLRVQANILHNLDTGELPDDVVVRDLNSVLGTAAMDMRNACPKTKSVVDARIAARFDEADESARADLVLIAEAAATLSDAELAEEFREDAQVATDLEAPEGEKKPALYRLVVRLVTMVTVAGASISAALKELGALSDGVVAFKEILYAILRFVLSI